MSFLVLLLTLISQAPVETVVVEVRSRSRAVAQVEVVSGEQAAVTNANGEAVLLLPRGPAEITFERFGFTSQTIHTNVPAGTTVRLVVELQPEVVLREEITVTATRTERRIEDEPLRVEVVDADEIEEKTLMTPGDIAMLLNETSGLRVQVTAPSLGAANVRVQGLRGRYTQLLADGLPLYGGQTGAVGLLQIPPMDLGQVEVIKGVASALYGSSALGGVINLVSRRPRESERELLINRTSLNGTDAGFWFAEPMKNGWSYTLLGGTHFQDKADVDQDGWADLSGYRRALVRPRVFWDNGSGRSVFATAGVMIEDREGGTIGKATVGGGGPFTEALDTRRFDGGMVGRFVFGKQLVSVRGSVMTQRHRHQFGDVIERDRHHTWFGEAALSGSGRGHTWIAGSAIQSDLYRSRDIPRFDYTYTVPAVFIQDEYSFGSRVTLSGSGRLDIHSDYGTFFNPRFSALFRMPKSFVARISTGTGVFAPTPFTEETEAVGLSNLQSLRNLKAEGAWSASGDLGWSRPGVELNGSVFGSIIRDAVQLRPSAGGAGGSMEIANTSGPTRTAGTELSARLRRTPFGLTLTHTFIHSTEIDIRGSQRDDVPLTPRHTAGMVGTWEDEDRGRIGVELFYTGRQRLDDNPYRDAGVPYWIVGLLAERRFGVIRLFINGENLTNVRQTRHEPIVRPQRNFDGRWTVDAWAPLDGRVVNGGIRISF